MAKAKKAAKAKAKAKSAARKAPKAKAAARSARPAKKEIKPAEAAWLIPYLTVRDVGAAAAFYERAFGFQRGNTMPDPGGRLVHAEMKHKDQIIVMMGVSTPEMPSKTPAELGGCPIGLYVYVDDVDAHHQHSLAAGARERSAPTTQFWGDRMCICEDLDGYRWTFATKVGEHQPPPAAPPGGGAAPSGSTPMP